MAVITGRMRAGTVSGSAALMAVCCICMTTALAAVPSGWILSGSSPESYEVGTGDPDNGKTAAYIRALVASPRGFGTLMQTISADGHRGQRIRLSGTIRCIDVTNWAGLWMRIDDGEQAPLEFDNMRDRPISGTTDWQQYEIVLDVPGESVAISFGILLVGAGQVWLDNLQFEEVDESVSVTNRPEPVASDPSNLDFEQSHDR